jgi:hypothetical protein
MKLLRFAAAVAVLSCAGGAQAQYKDGGYYLAERLFDECRGDSAEVERCQTYIIGVADSVMYDWAETLCIPDKTTPAELRELFMRRYVSDNGYHPAAVEVRAALQAAYPCPPPR